MEDPAAGGAGEEAGAALKTLQIIVKWSTKLPEFIFQERLAVFG